MFFLLAPPAVQAPVTKPVAWVEAVEQLLEHYDLYGSFKDAPAVKPLPQDRMRLRWLLSAATEAPRNPFPKHHKAFREVEACVALVKTSGPLQPALTLQEVGTQIALWRWGVHQVRQHRWDPRQRRAWEDHLLQPIVHGVLRGHVLRHALCFALAEDDGERLADLKERCGDEAPETFVGFQAAFSLKGGLFPDLRLWSLPELSPATAAFNQSGAKRIWISQFPKGPVYDLDAQTLWVIPTENGTAPGDVDTLDQASREEAVAIFTRLPDRPGKYWLAPSRPPLLRYGLVHFPIEIRLDPQGRVTSLHMGDAALAAGHTSTGGPRPLE